MLSVRISSAQSASAARIKHAFPNSDEYVGTWVKGLPDGEGQYTWADGSTYEGGWKVQNRCGRLETNLVFPTVCFVIHSKVRRLYTARSGG